MCFPAQANGQNRIGGMINAFQILRGDPGARERFQAMHNGMTPSQIVQTRHGVAPTATGG